MLITQSNDRVRAFAIVGISGVFVFAMAQTASAFTPEEILESQYNTAFSLQVIFAGLREEVLSGPIYLASSLIGAGIFAIAAGWHFTSAIKARSTGDLDIIPILQSIFWIILVALLLGNFSTGSLLGRLSNSGAALMDGVANTTLKQISLGLNTDVIQAATVETQVDVLIDSGIARCAEEQEAGTRDECLVAVLDQAQDLIDPFRNSNVVDQNGDPVGENWARRVFLKAQDRIGAELNNKDSYGSSNFFSRLFTNASFPDLSPLILAFLYVVGAIFGYVQSVGVIVMLVVAPIYLALSLSPLHRGAFARWVVNFFNLGLLKITFFLISSLAAWASLLSDIDPHVFPLVVALTSLIYSFQIISGAGATLAVAPAGALALGSQTLRGARSLVRR